MFNKSIEGLETLSKGIWKQYIISYVAFNKVNVITLRNKEITNISTSIFLITSFFLNDTWVGLTITPALLNYCGDTFLIFPLVFLIQLGSLAIGWTIRIRFIQKRLNGC